MLLLIPAIKPVRSIVIVALVYFRKGFSAPFLPSLLIDRTYFGRLRKLLLHRLVVKIPTLIIVLVETP